MSFEELRIPRSVHEPTASGDCGGSTHEHGEFRENARLGVRLESAERSRRPVPHRRQQPSCSLRSPARSRQRSRRWTSLASGRLSIRRTRSNACPGPELGDYTGLPLTEAARLRADSWDADRISVVQEYQCRPHSADYGLRGLAPIRIWADYDDATQRIVAFHVHIGAYENKRTDLSRRTAASSRLRRAHLSGVLDRRVGRQHADDHDHAPQSELPAAQRRPSQRQGAADGALEHPSART